MIKKLSSLYIWLCFALLVAWSSSVLASESYQIAKATFLPDYGEDLSFSGNTSEDGNYNQNFCSDYTLYSCPEGGYCSTCPSNSSLFKLNSCKSGYKKSGNTCVPTSCSAMGYETSVPKGKVCTAVSASGLNCFKDCKDVNCDGYTVDCNSNPTNSSQLTTCPVCLNANANCDTDVCKILQCKDGYKVNADGTACVLMDDNCPEGYYKECETGTQGDPVLTEAGTQCWQCKPKTQTCAIGQIDTNTYWCTVPQSIDCYTLGYKRSRGSCGSLSQVPCPFDASAVACIDFE